MSGNAPTQRKWAQVLGATCRYEGEQAAPRAAFVVPGAMSFRRAAGLGAHDDQPARPPRSPCLRRRGPWRRRPARSGRAGRGPGRRRGRRRGRRADGPGLDLPHRLDHEADHRRGGDDARRRRPARAGGPGRALAAGAGVAGGGPHARRAPSTTWCPPSGRSPCWTCSPRARATAGRRTSRCRRSSCCSTSRPTAGGPARPSPTSGSRELARVPLLYQPGEAWLYDTCSDLQGILVARASGQSLPEFFAERHLRAARHGRHRLRRAGGEARPPHQLLPAATDGGLELADAPDGELEPAAGVPGRLGRPGLDRRRLAPLRPACCSAAARSTAAACCRPSPCGR